MLLEITIINHGLVDFLSHISLFTKTLHTQNFLKNMGFIGFNCNQSLQKKKKAQSTLHKLTEITVVNSKRRFKIHSTV